ncbi:MAG: dicarboxylate/amino acid:cation symporter [Puniceicoccales bacterium]|jgi:Na+/H+-dicarboxylate symporter|nr:dicarboxylate/amino acid:cation symporter [Puniceicoccales bacterium]
MLTSAASIQETAFNVSTMKAGKMPFLLLLIMLATPFLEPAMCVPAQRFFLGISLAINEIILFFLPVVVFMLLFEACMRFSQSAPRIIARTLLLICLSNAITTSIGSCIGLLSYRAPMAFIAPSAAHELLPLFNLQMPMIIRNDLALLCGISAGILLPRYLPTFSSRANKVFAQFNAKIFRIILHILPAFIFGFTLKICHEGSLIIFLRNYISLFGIIITASLLYIFLLYTFAIGGNMGALLQCVKNMIPAVSCAFCTMSSTATMPITIDCVSRNGRDKMFVRSMVPMSTNVHLIGNNFTIAILAFAILAGYQVPCPSALSIGSFIACALVAKFSVVGVPGGSIFVMLPILERYLHFEGEMCSTIFTVNMLACPIITAINVLGNGAFALVAERFCIQRNSHQ